MTTFKEVFDVYTTPNLNIKPKRKKHPMYRLALCCVVLLGVMITASSSSDMFNVSSTSEININQLHKILIIDSDISFQEVTNLSYPFIQELENQYTLLDSKAVYNSQNQLDSYQLYFDGFKISFSETNTPVSNYAMTKEKPQYTLINDAYVAIYECDNLLLAIFEHNHMFFEIELQNSTVEELISIIHILIQK